MRVKETYYASPCLLDDSCEPNVVLYTADNYERAHTHTHTHAHTHSNRSAAHMAIGQYDKSIDDADSALRLRPQWVKGFLRKGDALKAAGRVRAAVSVYEEGLQVDSESADLRDRLASAIAQLQSLEEAERRRQQEEAAEAAKREEDAEQKRKCDEAKARLAQVSFAT